MCHQFQQFALHVVVLYVTLIVSAIQGMLTDRLSVFASVQLLESMLVGAAPAAQDNPFGE